MTSTLLLFFREARPSNSHCRSIPNPNLVSSLPTSSSNVWNEHNVVVDPSSSTTTQPLTLQHWRRHRRKRRHGFARTTTNYFLDNTTTRTIVDYSSNMWDFFHCDSWMRGIVGLCWICDFRWLGCVSFLGSGCFWPSWWTKGRLYLIVASSVFPGTTFCLDWVDIGWLVTNLLFWKRLAVVGCVILPLFLTSSSVVDHLLRY